MTSEERGQDGSPSSAPRQHDSKGLTTESGDGKNVQPDNTTGSDSMDRLTPRLGSGLWYLDVPEDRGGYFGSGN